MRIFSILFVIVFSSFGICGEVTKSNDFTDHSFVLGTGIDGELDEGTFNYGPSLFVEFPIIDQLEFEPGLSNIIGNGGSQTTITFIVEHSTQVSKFLEFEVGIGPQIVAVSGTQVNGTFLGGELDLELMFWPSQRVGAFLSPSLAFLSQNGIQSNSGFSAGTIIGFW